MYYNTLYKYYFFFIYSILRLKVLNSKFKKNNHDFNINHTTKI